MIRSFKAAQLKVRTTLIAFSTVLAFIVAAGSSGCSDSDPDQDADNPFQGLNLEVAVPTRSGFRGVWKPLLDEWSAQTSAHYSIGEYDAIAPVLLPEDTKSIADALKSEPGSRDAWNPTVVVFPITRVAEFHAAGLLGAIPEEQLNKINLNWLDLFQGLREQVGSIERRPTVVPLSCPVFVCYYRKDLFEAHGLSEPKTWEDYQALLDTSETWAPGMRPVEPWGEAYRATMFLTRAVSYAKHPANYSLFFDIQSGEPLIDSPGFERAFQAALLAVAKMPEDVTTYNPHDCRRAILSGKAAMAITFETGLGNPALAFGPRAADEIPDQQATANVESVTRVDAARIGFCRLPGSLQVFNLSTKSWEMVPGGGVNQVTLAAFAGLCGAVTATATDAETQASWNLLTTLAVQNLGSAFPGSTKSLCRESQLTTPTSWVGDELSVEEVQRYLSVVAGSLRDTRLVADLPVVGRHLFRRSLSESIGLVLSKKSSPQEALAATARQWRELIEQTGTDVVRDSYRNCLGLKAAPKR